MPEPWTVERKLKLIGDGGGYGLGIEWWKQTCREALAEIERIKATAALTPDRD
jgi:hypothetical protein